ncbi:MAG TPA: hypothetical protein VGK25_10500 [Ignavibacteria bacterium]|jgi:hypothetical protein
MITSKLTEILKSLSEDELKEFEKFIKSPYFNRGRNLLPYFKTFKKFYPEFIDPSFTKEYLFRKLYPEKGYDPKKSESILSTLNSDLVRMLEDFLIYKYLDREKIKKNLLLNYEFYDRDLNELADKNKNRIISELNSRGIDEDYFLHTHLFNSQLADVNIKLRNKDKSFQYEEDGAIYRFLYFFQDLLKRFSVFNVRKKEFTGPNKAEPMYLFLKQNLDIEKLMEKVRDSKSEYAIIEVYYWWMKSHENYGNISYYERFKNSVFLNLDKFTHLEKLNLLRNLISFLNISERMGYGNFSGKKIEVINKMIDNEIYNDVKNSMIYDRIYFEMLNSYLESDKIIEAEKFIEKYSEKLEEKIKPDAINQSYALLHFHKRNFNESLHHLTNINNREFNIKSSLKIIEIMCLYELKGFEQLEYVIAAARKHLHQNKAISKSLIATQKNFIGIIEKLIKCNENNNDDIEIKKIKEDIDSSKYIYKKNWLLQKVEELENHA